MCGICGDVDLLGAPDEGPVRRMARALAHRGPDAEGFFLEGSAALGHRVSATNLQRVLARRGVLIPTGGTAPPGPSGGRPAALYRFAEHDIRVTDPFAVLRPPEP